MGAERDYIWLQRKRRIYDEQVLAGLTAYENSVPALALGYPPFEKREGWGSHFNPAQKMGQPRPKGTGHRRRAL